MRDVTMKSVNEGHRAVSSEGRRKMAGIAVKVASERRQEAEREIEQEIAAVKKAAWTYGFGLMGQLVNQESRPFRCRSFILKR